MGGKKRKEFWHEEEINESVHLQESRNSMKVERNSLQAEK